MKEKCEELLKLAKAANQAKYIDDESIDILKDACSPETITELCEAFLKYRGALLSIKTDAIHCELDAAAAEFIITSWSMKKVDEALSESGAGGV